MVGVGRRNLNVSLGSYCFVGSFGGIRPLLLRPTLLEHELRDRTQLRRLRRRLRTYGDVAMWELLIDLMRSDTDKHICIFRFVLSNETSTRRLGRMFHRHRRQRPSRQS